MQKGLIHCRNCLQSSQKPSGDVVALRPIGFVQSPSPRRAAPAIREPVRPRSTLRAARPPSPRPPSPPPAPAAAGPRHSGTSGGGQTHVRSRARPSGGCGGGHGRVPSGPPEQDAGVQGLTGPYRVSRGSHLVRGRRHAGVPRRPTGEVTVANPR